jgi:hypothetical protein
MSEHQKQTAFLRRLICCEDIGEHRDLEAQLAKAERDESVIRCAIRLVALVAGLALAGYCYAAVFLPDFPQDKSHFILKFFCVLGLGSLICLVCFFGAWFWHRSLLNRLREECRRLVTAILERRLQNQRTIPFPEVVKEQSLTMYQNETMPAEPPASAVSVRTAL